MLSVALFIISWLSLWWVSWCPLLIHIGAKSLFYSACGPNVCQPNGFWQIDVEPILRDKSYWIYSTYFINGEHIWLGKCDICAKEKILFANGTKWYKILTRPKGWVQKIFQTLLPNWALRFNESYVKSHPFCMAWMKVSEMKNIFNQFFNSV